MYYANSKHKKTGLSILKTDKVELKTENIFRDKEWHFILVKGSVHQESIIINVYELNDKVPKYMK